MERRAKILRLALLLATVLATLSIYLQWHCPQHGLALLPTMPTVIRLKNRIGMPQEADFDNQVTLAALLQPGDDRGRWSEARAAAVEGYVVGVQEGSIE